MKSINELRKTIAGIIEEKKKPAKAKKAADDAPQLPRHLDVYGQYDKEHDFSEPQGERNLYRQQGAVNYGPNTGGTPELAAKETNPNAVPAGIYMRESDERAIRQLVREVIQNGLIDESSAWAPFVTNSEPIFESSWAEIEHALGESYLGGGGRRRGKSNDPQSLRIRAKMNADEIERRKQANAQSASDHGAGIDGDADEFRHRAADDRMEEGTWQSAERIAEAWYDNLKGEKKDDNKAKKKNVGEYDKTKFGPLKNSEK